MVTCLSPVRVIARAPHAHLFPVRELPYLLRMSERRADRENSARLAGHGLEAETRPGARPGAMVAFGLFRDPRMLALILAAVVLRVWSILALSGDLRIRDPILDGLHYLTLATRLSEGGGWPAEPHFFTPLYPLVLSLIFRVAPPSPLTAQIFQGLLGLATLGLLIAAARRDLGERAAWAVGILLVLCGPVLGMESQLLTESLLLFLTAVALYLWPRPDRRAVTHLAFGIVCGLLTVGRAIFLLLPIAALLQLWRERRRAGSSGRPAPATTPSAAGAQKRRPEPARAAPMFAAHALAAPTRRLHRSALVALGVLATLLPLVIHQTRATGRLEFLTVNGGVNLYFGNHPGARGIFSVPPEIDLNMDYTAARSASILAGRDLNLAQSDRFWRDRALVFMREHPTRALWLLGRKALLYLSPREVPQIEDFQVLKGIALPLRLAFVDFRWILPLAALGLIVGLRSRQTRLAPWLLLALVGWISTLIFFATGRYRVSVLPGFLAPASLGAVALFEMVRARRARAIALIIPAVVILQLVLPGYPVQKAQAFDAYQLAIRQGRHGETVAALESYRRAAQLWPADGDAWHGMGVCLSRMGRLQEAAEAFRKAAEMLPRSAPTHYGLALVYIQLGDDARALAELQTAVGLNPYDTDMRNNLAVALYRTGHTQEAVEEWRRVLRMNPADSSARQNLEGLGLRP